VLPAEAWIYARSMCLLKMKIGSPIARICGDRLLPVGNRRLSTRPWQDDTIVHMQGVRPYDPNGFTTGGPSALCVRESSWQQPGPASGARGARGARNGRRRGASLPRDGS